MSKSNHTLSLVYGFRVESGFMAVVWLAIAGLWSFSWWLD